MTGTADDLHKALAFALEKYPHRVELAPIEKLLIDAAREGAKRPAYIKIAVSDEIVKSLRGRKPANDHLLLVRLPREMADRAASPIILPNEVG